MKKDKKGRLFVISAPSGTGKTTLSEKLLAICPNLKKSISVTTRAMRRDEKDGDDYFFVSRDEFENKKNRGEFFEWAQVLGNFYATSRKFVEEVMGQGLDVLLVIDVQGAMQVKKLYPDASLVFVIPPSIETLRQRLQMRATEDDLQIAERLKLAESEIKFKNKYDYVVINDNLKDAVDKIKKIIQKDKLGE